MKQNLSLSLPPSPSAPLPPLPPTLPTHPPLSPSQCLPAKGGPAMAATPLNMVMRPMPLLSLSLSLSLSPPPLSLSLSLPPSPPLSLPAPPSLSPSLPPPLSPFPSLSLPLSLFLSVLTSQGRPSHGGHPSKHGHEAEAVGQFLQAQQVTDEDGRQRDEGRCNTVQHSVGLASQNSQTLSAVLFVGCLTHNLLLGTKHEPRICKKSPKNRQVSFFKIKHL